MANRNESKSLETRIEILERDHNKFTADVSNRLSAIEGKLDKFFENNRKPITVTQSLAIGVMLFTIGTGIVGLLNYWAYSLIQPYGQADLVLSNRIGDLEQSVASTNSEFGKYRILFSGLETQVGSHSKFVDRWYNEFRPLERFTEVEGEQKLLSKRIEELERKVK